MFTKREYDFICNCVSDSRVLDLARCVDFDDSTHNKMLEKLALCKSGVDTKAVPFIVEFTYDNGVLVDNMQGVCLAFDEDDARRIIENKYSKCSDDTIVVNSIRIFTDKDIVCAKV